MRRAELAMGRYSSATTRFWVFANRSRVLLLAFALTGCATDSAIKADADRRAVPESPYAIVPERLFDGFAMREGYGVAVGGATRNIRSLMGALPTNKGFEIRRDRYRAFQWREDRGALGVPDRSGLLMQLGIFAPRKDNQVPAG